ncbi:hypothetical protein [Vagococcus jeotgali]|uniref:hypothetical protein n=1 Tax=Vagococcus jeotgali TaxID=3109030 RepID=UPI002DDB1B33|nr:hypothetical protein [Vagococcus sp. B2T-5]
MSKLSDCQILVFQNKIQKNFNTINIEKEFLLLYGEVSEAFEIYKKNELKKLAKGVSRYGYLLGLSEILNIDLDKAIKWKIEINMGRKYIYNDMVMLRNLKINKI